MHDAQVHTPAGPNAGGDPVVVYAKWMGRLTTTPPTASTPSYIDRYHVAIPPRIPLAVGQKVKIHALSRVAYHLPTNNPTQRAIYDTYDPQICGRIVRIRAMTVDMVEFVLDNEAPNEAVVLAYIAVQKIPNYTTKLAEVEKICRWETDNHRDLFLPFIPLETAVIACDTVTVVSGVAEIRDQGGEPGRLHPTGRWHESQ